MKNGFKKSNYTIKERKVMYAMLYYSQDDKKVKSQEYQEMIKDYLGILLYKRFYKKYGNNK